MHEGVWLEGNTRDTTTRQSSGTTRNHKGSLRGHVVLRRTITYWRTFLYFETPLEVL